MRMAFAVDACESSNHYPFCKSLGIPFHQKFHFARVSLGLHKYRLSDHASGYDFDFIIGDNQHSGSIRRRSIIGDEIKTIENVGVEIEPSNGNASFS
jgi:hypothetical protein